jgi:hypothetical protein
MKTLNHTVSFPSTVGELVVQYNFTEAEPAQIYHSGKKEWITATNWTPAEVEITDVSAMLFGHLSCYFDETDTERAKNNLELKQAIYTEHMRLLKEKEDAEAKRQDSYKEQVEYHPGLYPHTSALHEHAKAMFDLGQSLLKDSIKSCAPEITDFHINKERQQLELTITEPEQLYPYSAEIPACVQQKGIYVKMPKGVPLPDHILDVGNHLEQPEI